MTLDKKSLLNLLIYKLFPNSTRHHLITHSNIITKPVRPAFIPPFVVGAPSISLFPENSQVEEKFSSFNVSSCLSVFVGVQNGSTARTLGEPTKMRTYALPGCFSKITNGKF